MAEKKRHHFVPQFYLRYFSKDKRNIKVFSVEERRIITKNAPIRSQSYQNYMYGKHRKIEDAISLIEKETKKIFEKIVTLKKLPRKRDPDYTTLLVFILYQAVRTSFAAEQINEVIDKFVKSIIKDDVRSGKSKGIGTEDIDKFIVSVKNPGLFNLSIASRIIPLLSDLNCKLIINKTNNEFITSDNPVIRYNKYYLNDIRGLIGFACKGLLILFPLTPRYYLIYYDPVIYKIGGKTSHKPVTQLDERDVDELNILQLINSNKVVYTLNMSEKYLRNIFTAEIQNYRFGEKSILRESKYVDHENGKKSKLIWSACSHIEYDADISFIRINKKIPYYYQKQNLVRNPDLVDLHREFLERVENKEYEVSEWGRFLYEKITGQMGKTDFREHS